MPLRREDWVLCVRLCIVRVSVGLFWLVSLVFHYWVEKKTLLEWLGSFVFGLPLTAKWHQFRMVQAPFTKYAGCKNIVKNAFVRLKLQENGYPIQYKPLTIQTIPYRYPSKKNDPIAVSANPTIDHSQTHRSRRNKQSIPQ